ncbi:MAG TPA: hypothetical protein VLS44_11545 [Nitrospira sp.]|nr:hypothetical protein [Nitrospira sp.]
MTRRLPALVVALVILCGLASGCIPRHPPHTPQPVPEAPGKQPGPADQL